MKFFRLSLLANQFPALHGMRVLAILAVIQFHVTDGMVLHRFPIDLGFAMRSYTIFFGMDLFFILSGLLIGTILLHAIDAGGRERSIWNFYARRSFRIFPLYYIVLTTLWLLFPVNRLQHHNLVFEYTYLTNYVRPSPVSVIMRWGWSLCVEEHFYLAAPLLVGGLQWLRSQRARFALLVALWALGLAVRLWIFYSAKVPWTDHNLLYAVYEPTHARFDILIAGVFLAFVQHTRRDSLRSLFASRLWCWAFGLMGFACFVALMNPLWFPNFFLFRVLSYGTLTSLMYAPWILVLLNTDGWIVRFLSHRAFLLLATLGYGIYLVHIPIIEHVMLPIGALLILRRHFTGIEAWWVMFAGALALSAALAYLLHLAVDKPALHFRDRITGR